MKGRWKRLVLGLALTATLGGIAGCSPLGERVRGGGIFDAVGAYAWWRVEDALETIDLGITTSTRPYGAFYGNFASLTPFGIGYLDGDFIGIGGGQIGVTRHYFAGVGALAWGYEESGWQDYDRHDLSTLNTQGVGPIGLIAPPYGRPGSAPS